jgi:hypothetical protein
MMKPKFYPVGDKAVARAGIVKLMHRAVIRVPLGMRRPYRTQIFSQCIGRTEPS